MRTTVHVHCQDLVRIYKIADLEVVALRGLNLEVAAGEMMAIVGNSGSGKSTLLNILGGLDRPSAGACTVGGLDLVNASGAELAEYKRYEVGFVWQQSARNLIPYLGALDNVLAPMLFAGGAGSTERRRARELLAACGLSERMDHKPPQLSGGEQQRVAIAVALANEPELLLADEPTGEVDNQTAGDIYELLRRLNAERRLTVMIVTHDRDVTRHVSRVVAIRDGQTSSEIVQRVGLPGADEPAHEEYVIVVHHHRAVGADIEGAGPAGVEDPRHHLLELEGRALVHGSRRQQHFGGYFRLPGGLGGFGAGPDEEAEEEGGEMTHGVLPVVRLVSERRHAADRERPAGRGARGRALTCKNPTRAPARQVSAGRPDRYGITLAGARFMTQSPVRMSDTKMLPL